MFLVKKKEKGNFESIENSVHTRHRIFSFRKRPASRLYLFLKVYITLKRISYLTWNIFVWIFIYLRMFFTVKSYHKNSLIFSYVCFFFFFFFLMTYFSYILFLNPSIFTITDDNKEENISS